MKIELETLNLIRYNYDKHNLIKEELSFGNSNSKYVQKISERLELSSNNDKSIYQSAFVVEDKGISIGYLYISNVSDDEVFLECSILKDFRKKGYGSKILKEVSEYLFQKENIRNIRLDIEPSNIASISTAKACGFDFDQEEYENRNFIGKMQFIKESDCYISKRKK